MIFPEVENTETTVLIETPTYKSETWEHNQANHTQFALTTNGGNSFSVVTYTKPQRGDETLHGTQEEICAIIADCIDEEYELVEKKVLAHFHNGEDAIDPIAFFAGQAANDWQVWNLENENY